MDKEYDMLSLMLKNPDSTMQDIASSGIDIGNIGIQSEKDYMNLNEVKNDPKFLDQSGKFDQGKFHKEYQQALFNYNYLASQDNYKYSKYDIFAPPEKRDFTPGFTITNTQNPYRTTHGLTGLNEEGPRTLSIEEIAQTQPVFNTATKKWEDAPNDSFFNLLDEETRVLAQYDNDEDSKDPVTGEIIHHKKGDYKYNDNGTFYYETANGRNINGKTVLHLSDVLTTDGSTANSIDFLDSDGLDKSPVGTVMKNVALIGSMFLPYVGPVVAGTAVLQQSMKLGATLGKMLLGSESPEMNSMIGLASTTNFFENKSEHAKDPDHPWCWENFVGLLGDSIGQLREQRLIFKYIPALFKGKYGAMGEDGEKLLFDEEASKIKAFNQTQLSKLQPLSDDWINLKAEQQALTTVKAQAKVDKYMKDYYDLGGYISKAYMTGITVNDMYQESKDQGASDIVAMGMTIGYAAAEYKLLSTGLGEHILPELRAVRAQKRAIVKALGKEAQTTIKSLNDAVEQTVAKDEKQTLFKKIFNFGKSIFNADYVVAKKGLKSVAAAGLGEGTEEVSEEALNDLFRGFYDATNWLSGNKTHMLNMQGWGDRYLLNFVGGLVGGSVNAAASDFTMWKKFDNLTANDALRQYIQLKKEGEADGIRKVLDSEEFGNKHLSATQYDVDDEGRLVGFKPGTQSDNQDKMVKDTIKSQLDLIDQTLSVAESEGASLSDKSVLDANTLRDLRYAQLQHSATAGRLLEVFNSDLTDMVKAAINLHQANTPEAKAEAGEGDQKAEKSPILEQERAKYKKQYDEAKQRVIDTATGKNAPLFMVTAIMEGSPTIATQFMQSTFDQFSYNKYKKHVNELSDDEKKTTYQEYLAFKNGEAKDQYEQIRKNYLALNKLAAAGLMPKIEEYQKQYTAALESPLQQLYDVLYSAQGDPEKYLSYSDQLIRMYAPVNAHTLASSLDQEQLNEDNPGLTPEQNLQSKQQYAQLSDQDKEISREAHNFITKYNANLMAESDENGTEETKQKATNENTIMSSQYLTSVFPKILQSYKTKGWANPTVKYHLQNIIDSVKGAIDEADRAIFSVNPSYDDDGNEDTDETGRPLSEVAKDNISNSTYAFLSAITGKEWNRDNIQDFIQDDANNQMLDNLRDQYADLSLEGISNSPVSEILDKFNLDIHGGEAKQSGALSAINHLLLQTSTGDATLDEETQIQLQQALNAVSLLNAWIQGARVDAAGVYKTWDPKTDNPLYGAMDFWGINKTLNDIAKKGGYEGWQELPTMDSKTADAIIQDLNLIAKRIHLALNLNEINRGRQLQGQTRVKTRVHYLKALAVSRLCDVDPTDEDLMKAKIQAKNIQDIERNKGLQVSKEDRINLEKATIEMEQSVHDYFEKNSDKDLTQVLSKYGNMWALSDDLLTEGKESFNNRESWYYLASVAALDPISYYKVQTKALDADQEIAPIPGQEIEAMLNYANVINGDKITEFQEALQRFLIQDFMNSSTEQRIKKLKDSGLKDADATTWATDKFAPYVINLAMIPKFSNITMSEGIPGAGKTLGGGQLLIDLLNQSDKTKPTLQHAYVVKPVHKDAEDYANKLKLTGFEAFDVLELLKKISNIQNRPTKDKDGNFVYDNSEFAVNEVQIGDQKVKKIEPTYDLKEVTDVPSIIILDEVTRFTDLELQIIDKFAKAHGISVVTYGDFDQSKARGTLTFKIGDQKVSMQVKLDRENIIHSTKIGTSMRILNSQKHDNIISMWQFTHGETPNLKLKYYEGERTPGQMSIRGEKVFEMQEGKMPANSQSFIDSVDLMIKTLAPGQKIGYIYQDTSSEVYKLLDSPKYKDYITKYKGTSAQGNEAQYFIIEPNIHTDKEQYLDDLYTDITRSEQASLILLPPTDELGMDHPINVKEEVTQDITIAGVGASEAKIKQVIKDFSKEKNDITKKVLELNKEVVDKTDLKQRNRTTTSNVPPKINPTGNIFPFVDPKDVVTTQDNNTADYKFGEGIAVPVGWISDIAADLNGAELPNLETLKLKEIKVIIDDSQKENITFTFTDGTTDYIEKYTGNKSLMELTNSQFNFKGSFNTVHDTEKAVEDNPEPPKPVLTPKPEEAKPSNGYLNNIIHTFSTFELGGWTTDDNGKLVYSQEIQDLITTQGQEAVDKFMQSRIDSVNGLLKLAPDLDYTKALAIIGEIRKIATSIKDINVIKTRLKQVFTDNGIDIKDQDLRAQFAFKKNIVEGQDVPYVMRMGKVDSDLSQFTNVKGEESLFNEYEGNGGSVNPHKICLEIQIGNEQIGYKYLEFPIATINAPISLIQIKDADGKYIFERFYDQYQQKLEATKSAQYPNGNVYQAVRHVLEVFDEDKNLSAAEKATYDKLSKANIKDLSEADKDTLNKLSEKRSKLSDEERIIYKLFKIYAEGQAHIIYLDKDFTLAGELSNLGVTIAHLRGAAVNDFQHLYVASNQPIYNIRANTQLFVSRITCATSERGDIDVTTEVNPTTDTLDNKLKTENTQTVKVAHNRHAFVLVSSYPGVNSSNIEDVYLFDQAYNQEHPDAPLHRVSRIYVLPPKLTYEQYSANLNDFSTTKAAITTNRVTSYKIFKLIEESGKLGKLIANAAIDPKDDTIEYIESRLAELDSAYEEGKKEGEYTKLDNLLSAQATDSKHATDTIERLIVRTLSKLSYTEEVESKKWVPIQDNVKLIQSILDEKKFVIYNNFKINTQSKELFKDILVSSIKGQQYSSILPDGNYGDWTVLGKVLTPTYMWNKKSFEDMLDNIIAKQSSSTKNNTITISPAKKTPQKIRSDELKTKLGVIIDLEGKTTEEQNINIINAINSDTNNSYVAMTSSNGKVVVFEDPSFKGKTISIDNNQLKVGDDLYQITLNSDGSIELTQTVQNTQNSLFTPDQIKTITDNINAYQNSATGKLALPRVLGAAYSKLSIDNNLITLIQGLSDNRIKLAIANRINLLRDLDKDSKTYLKSLLEDKENQQVCNISTIKPKIII